MPKMRSTAHRLAHLEKAGVLWSTRSSEGIKEHDSRRSSRGCRLLRLVELIQTSAHPLERTFSNSAS